MQLKDTVGPLSSEQLGTLLGLALNVPAGQGAALLGASHNAAYYVAAGLKVTQGTTGAPCYVVENWAKLPPKMKDDFFATGRELALVPPIISLHGDPAELILSFREPPPLGLLVVEAPGDHFALCEAVPRWALAVRPGGLIVCIDCALPVGGFAGIYPDWAPRGQYAGLSIFVCGSDHRAEFMEKRHNEWFRQSLKQPSLNEQRPT